MTSDRPAVPTARRRLVPLVLVAALVAGCGGTAETKPAPNQPGPPAPGKGPPKNVPPGGVKME